MSEGKSKFIAVMLMEIWEAVWRVIMLVKAILERREARRLEKARLAGLAEGLSEAKRKHAEWVEWAKNGQDKPQPNPPKYPETDE